MRTNQNGDTATGKHKTNDNRLLLGPIDETRHYIITRCSIALVLLGHDEAKGVNVKVAKHKTSFYKCSARDHEKISEKKFRWSRSGRRHFSRFILDIIFIVDFGVEVIIGFFFCSPNSLE